MNRTWLWNRAGNGADRMSQSSERILNIKLIANEDSAREEAEGRVNSKKRKDLKPGRRNSRGLNPQKYSITTKDLFDSVTSMLLPECVRLIVIEL